MSTVAVIQYRVMGVSRDIARRFTLRLLFLLAVVWLPWAAWLLSSWFLAPSLGHYFK